MEKFNKHKTTRCKQERITEYMKPQLVSSVGLDISQAITKTYKQIRALSKENNFSININNILD